MKKILIVDDQPSIRELISETLNGVGDYKIMESASGEQAIETAKAEKPDLIFMDVMMQGGMDGYETTKILKNDPVTKNCVIILLTARGQQVDKEKGFKAGADDYFVKPFSPLGLIKKVEEVLED